MRLLLDSHAFLWFCEGNESLSANARTAIEDPENEKFVSHATAWEIAIKLSLGKLTLKTTYESLFPGAVEANGFRSLQMQFLHYREVISMPLHHRDPFDRLIVAQARVDGLTLVSRDTSLAAYAVPIIW